MRIKRFWTFLLFVVFIIIAGGHADAAFESTGHSFVLTEGGIQYLFYIHKNTDSSNYIFPNHDACYPIYHVKNNSSITLNYSLNVSYNSETTNQFAHRWTTGITNEELSLLIETEHLTQNTSGFSHGATGGVAATLQYSAPTGYYKLALCHNYRQYKLLKCTADGVGYIGSDIVSIPYGVPYLAVVFSTSSGSGYSIYG